MFKGILILSISLLNILIGLKPAVAAVSGNVSVARSNSLYKVDGNTAAASWDFAGIFTYAFNEKLASTLIVEGSQDLKTPEESDFSRGQIKTSHALDHGKKSLLLLKPSITFGFPVSRAQNSASFLGSSGLGMKFEMNPDRMLWKKMSAEFNVSGTRNFHKYETAVSGKQNNQYGSTQNMILGWSFVEGLDFSFEFDHLNTWSYQGTLGEYYVHVEELAWQTSKSLNLAIGHQYGNPYLSVWKDNQQEYNFKASDEQNSLVYAKLAFIF